MEPQAEFETLLNFFKVMGNDKRLRIVGILANQQATVGELAEMLDLREPTVSEHLAMLKEIDLVTVQPKGNHRIYAFNPKALHAMNKDMFSRERLASLVTTNADDSERKVLATYMNGEKIINLPASRKKLLVILRWLVERFEMETRYTEKEVNAIINQHHEDHATLRREMVDYRMMKREKGVYWRLPESEWLPDARGTVET